MIKVINKITFFYLRLLFLIKYSFSTTFRNKASFVSSQLDSLIQTLHNNFDNKLLELVIFAEDRRFFLHYGHDAPSILRAIFHNIQDREIHGASTIEQQLIRIITNDREKTYKRKIDELLLSTLFYKKYSKEQILLIYLSNYYFNDNKIGIESFCEIENYRFNELSNADIHEIVARLKYPNINSLNLSKYLKRVRTIEKMHLKI